MVCFVPIVCLSIRKTCQRRDCSELGNIRNWVEHYIHIQCLCNPPLTPHTPLNIPQEAMVLTQETFIILINMVRNSAIRLVQNKYI